ncbi:hypothetical protein BDW74DRAFT_154567, partial [Aspergillus multicolor]|uniref:uncharacterized protein n=1 Tax=Aspergillus multicolor TaxID=41759 RepID=UPI003CCCC546
MALVLGILSTSIAGLALVITHYTPQEHGRMTSPVAIGGRFSTIQAKAIDFACAVILAPLVMLFLDSVWFTSARVSVINEESPGAVAGLPLPCSVEASITSSGSFDFIQI